MSLQFELYTRGTSFLYRLDPRAKIIGVLVIFAISVIFTNPLYLAPFFLFILAIDFFGGVSLSRVALLLKSVTLLVVLSVVMWPLLYHPGREIYRFGSIYITDIGVAYGIGMAFRFLNMVMAPITLVLTTSQSDFVQGLRGIGLPEKGAFALATTFRFVPTVVGVGTSIIEAQRSRGLDVNQGSILKRLRNYAALLAPLMITSIRLAQQLALAVEAKAISSPVKRTTLRPLRFTSRDRLVLVAYGVVLVGVVVMRVLGLGAFAVH